jgi:hypothetical protein
LAGVSPHHFFGDSVHSRLPIDSSKRDRKDMPP